MQNRIIRIGGTERQDFRHLAPGVAVGEIRGGRNCPQLMVGMAIGVGQAAVVADIPDTAPAPAHEVDQSDLLLQERAETFGIGEFGGSARRPKLCGCINGRKGGIQRPCRRYVFGSLPTRFIAVVEERAEGPFHGSGKGGQVESVRIGIFTPDIPGSVPGGAVGHGAPIQTFDIDMADSAGRDGLGIAGEQDFVGIVEMIAIRIEPKGFVG